MRWTLQEIEILKDRDLTLPEIHSLLPHRSILGIRRKTYQLGCQRTLRRFGHITQEEADAIWSQAEFCQMIEGHLLGDGCVDKEGSTFRLGTNNEDYSKFIQLRLNKLANKNSKTTYHPPVTKMWKTGEYTSKESWSAHCCCSKIFRSQRTRWYPDGIKAVPSDLELTPLVCNRWYCDDGTLHIDRRARRKSVPTVELCTDSFSEKEICFLRNQIETSIGVLTSTRLVHKKFKRITIYSKFSVVKFLDYIGPCPVESFSYKWDVL